MRNIKIDLTSDNPTPQYLFVGYEGEHNATRLKVILPERMRLSGEVQYRFLFETAKGEAVFSAVMLPEDDGSLSVLLAQALMVPPVLKAYVGCYGTENGETVLVAKTPQMLLGVQKSIPEDQEELNVNGTCVPGLVIEKEVLENSENPVESRALYLSLAEKIDREELVGVVRETSSASASVPVSERAVSSALEKKVGWGDVKSTIDTTSPDSKKVPSEKAVSEALSEKFDCDRLLIYMPSDNLTGGATDSSEQMETTVSTYGLGRHFSQYVKKSNVESSFSAESANPIQNKTVSANVANAIKGKESGNAVSLVDVSPLEHQLTVKLSSETSDVNGAEVQKYGKNLLPYPYYDTTKTVNGITFTDNGDGTITANGTATANAEFGCARWNQANYFLPKGKKYYFKSYDSEHAGTVLAGLALRNNDGNQFDVLDTNGNGLSVEFSNDVNSVYCIARVLKGKTVNNLVFKPQLEVGTTATEHEPYVAPTTHTADENGNINGIIGNGENMTLIAGSGVNIECEYNKDTNKVIESLVNAIISLGGNV